MRYRPLLVLAAVGLLSGAALAELPPRGAKPLLEVLTSVEAAGYASITEASLDDGMWEIEALLNGQPIELRVDPVTAKIVGQRADGPHPALPAGAKSMTAIVAEVEKRGYTPIEEADFKITGWEIDARHESAPRSLYLDLDGRIVSEMADD